MATSGAPAHGALQMRTQRVPAAPRQAMNKISSPRLRALRLAPRRITSRLALTLFAQNCSPRRTRRAQRLRLRGAITACAIARQQRTLPAPLRTTCASLPLFLACVAAPRKHATHSARAPRRGGCAGAATSMGVGTALRSLSRGGISRGKVKRRSATSRARERLGQIE